MVVTVNGEDRRVEAGTTVGALVDEMADGERRGVAVAVDGQVVRRSQMDAVELSDGDEIELVGAVQGGG